MELNTTSMLYSSAGMVVLNASGIATAGSTRIYEKESESFLVDDELKGRKELETLSVMPHVQVLAFRLLQTRQHTTRSVVSSHSLHPRDN